MGRRAAGKSSEKGGWATKRKRLGRQWKLLIISSHYSRRRSHLGTGYHESPPPQKKRKEDKD
jgi:hypothetical protein